jgi:primary-amine oxidase
MPSALAPSKEVLKHPLDQLSNNEVNIAREIILKARQSLILFRNIFTVEPPKAQMIKFLAAESTGTLSSETPRPARQARVQYDVISQDKNHQYMESVVDLASATEISKRTAEKNLQQALTVDEFKEFNQVVVHSKLFQDAVAEFELPEGFEVAIDPWPYGGPDQGEDFTRFVARYNTCYRLLHADKI